MDSFPPFVRVQLKKIVSNIINGSTFDPKSWTFLSGSTLDHDTLFRAVTFLCGQAISNQKYVGDRTELIQNAYEEMKLSGFLLDALLTAFYENNVTDLNIWTNWVNTWLAFLSWSSLSSPTILSRPVPSNKSYDFLLINTVLAHSTPEEIANSDYINVPSDGILKKLTNTAAKNFIDAILIKFCSESKPLEDRIFSIPVLLNALLSKRDDYEPVDQILSITFQSKPNIVNQIKNSWEQIEKTNAARFIMHMVVPYSYLYPDDVLDHIINSGIWLNNEELDINALVSNKKCMSVADPKLIIDICSLDIDDQMIINVTNSLLQTIDPEHFIECLLDIKEEAIPTAAKTFQRILQTKDIKTENLDYLINRALTDRTETTCKLLDALIPLPGVAEKLVSESILITVTDIVRRYQELALSILFSATIKIDCSAFWRDTDACAILVDEIIMKRECGLTIDKFFNEIACEADENTLIAILPTISACQSLFDYFSDVLHQRFPADSAVIQELERLSF